MRRTAAFTAGIVVSLILISGAGASADRITEASVIALQNWIEAVNNHTPGRPDASVTTVAALSYQTRKDLNAGLGFFFSALMSVPVKADGYAKRITGIGHLLSGVRGRTSS
jgi:hypothetical protein